MSAPPPAGVGVSLSAMRSPKPAYQKPPRRHNAKLPSMRPLPRVSIARVRCIAFGFLVVILGLVPRPSSGAPLPTPPRDWKLEVVASAPQVRHPSVVCCAPDGRVFVAEDPM